MRFGFQVMNSGKLATAEYAVETAQRIEALGYETMVVTDHIVIPRDIKSRYPYNATGRLAVPPDADYFEALTMLSFLAGATKTIRFGPSVLVLPYRNPVLTAKMLSTMDVLSGGRLFVGVGVGWMAEEFEAMDSPPFEARGQVTDEWIELFIQLWTETNPNFQGQYYQIKDIGCMPKPVQKPYPPIWVGGDSKVGIRRAVKYGQSWHAFRIPAEELRGYLAYMDEQRRLMGKTADEVGLSVRYGLRVVGPGGDSARRDPEEPGKVFIGTADQVAEQLKPILDLGPTDAIFDCRTGTYEEMHETMARFAEEVRPRLEARVG